MDGFWINRSESIAQRQFTRILLDTKSSFPYNCFAIATNIYCWHLRLPVDLKVRYRPRLFDQVGHQTTSAYIENKHFFTKSCHRQTYKNYEQPPQSLQNLYFQNLFSASKINRIFLIVFFCKEYLTRRSTFINEIFWKLWFLK